MKTPHAVEHVLSFAIEQPWAVTPTMLSVIAQVLGHRIVLGPRANDATVVTRAPAAPSVGNGVMVLPLHGVLAPRMNLMSDISGGATFEEATNLLRSGVADRSVGTIVLDIDSPGGSVAGATEFAAEVLRAREVKHVIAHAHYEMASAAYWVGACAEEIVASPSAMVGSIGVYSIHEDLSQALEQLGVKLTYISAGKYKVDGNDTEPLSDTARARLQAVVDEAYGRFVTDVATGRRTTTDAIKNGYGQGSVVTASEAKALGMVDRIDTLDSTIARALTLPPLNADATTRGRIADTNELERALHALAF
jgi:signal peptide peptidase SppA